MNDKLSNSAVYNTYDAGRGLLTLFLMACNFLSFHGFGLLKMHICLRKRTTSIGYTCIYNFMATVLLLFFMEMKWKKTVERVLSC